MHCSKCGAKIPFLKKFCTQCGAPAKGEVEVEAVEVPETAAPAPQAAAPAVSQNPVNKLYLGTDGASFFNYKFEIKDEFGNLRYTAKTVTEKMFGYTLRVWYPDGTEAFTVQTQKKLTLASLHFEMLDANGNRITQILQRNKLTKFVYELPEFDMLADGDFISHKFDIMQGGRKVGFVDRKMMSWGDNFMIEFDDPAHEQLMIAITAAVELATAHARHQRAKRR